MSPYYVLYDGDKNLQGIHPGPQLPPLPPGISYETKDGPIPDLNRHVWNPETLTLDPMSGATVTRMEFMSRFTPAERIAVRTSTDPMAADIMNLIEVAEFIDPKDPRTTQAIQYLASVGLIPANRVEEVLR